ncbi:MAG: hypothetical protein HS113_16750 [Verrucomicrobiales bacterium]|nr:hypothetical protein [Verrucomicrobiales bacterium]
MRMLFRPTNWNVVVLGEWNVAIFTPEWIGKNVFGLAEGTPISVEVPINVRAPWRIKHQNVAVMASTGRIEFSCDSPTYATLDVARGFARTSLTELPRTPVSAAGFNLRFQSGQTPPELAEAISGGVDEALADAAYRIAGRATRRSLEFQDGLINCEIAMDGDETARITLNFHRGSIDPEELKRWLSIPIAEVEGHSARILSTLKGVTYEGDHEQDI